MRNRRNGVLKGSKYQFGDRKGYKHHYKGRTFVALKTNESQSALWELLELTEEGMQNIGKYNQWIMAQEAIVDYANLHDPRVMKAKNPEPIADIKKLFEEESGAQPTDMQGKPTEKVREQIVEAVKEKVGEIKLTLKITIE